MTTTAVDTIDISVGLILDGHRLALRGPERVAAIHAMSERGLPLHVIAARLCLPVDTARTACNRAGVTFPPPPQPWWVAYIEPSRARGYRTRRQPSIVDPLT